MLIVRIFGGLGNQMFQYALYKALRERGIEAYVDLSWFNNNDDHNGYELNSVFKLNPRIASVKLSNKLGENETDIFHRFYRKIIGHKETFIFHYGNEAVIYYPEIFKINNKYLSGYWQNYNYFKDISDIIKQDFRFGPIDRDNENNADLIKNVESVCIHIRRGDYLKDKKLRDVCQLKYYQKAVNYIKDRVASPVFFVFSDDINWCKKNLALDKAHYIHNNTGEKSYRDMQLMSLCKHNIIANSSFSWWGAWLNQNEKKIVIAPEKWMNKNLINDPICNDWMRVKS